MVIACKKDGPVGYLADLLISAMTAENGLTLG